VVYISNKKWDFKSILLKEKRSSKDYDSSNYHPNTPLTYTGNGKFGDHL
jgi:hypothetical protein